MSAEFGSGTRCAMSLLGAALVLLGAAQSQQRGLIRGVVRDPDGTPLPGVRVVAVSVLGETVRPPLVSVLTAENGTYTLHPRPGTFDVRAQLDGFCGGVPPRVRVDSGEAQTVDFTLNLSPVEQVSSIRFPLSETLARADVVVHLRIAKSHEPRLSIPDISCGNGNVFTEHELQVITAIKTDHVAWSRAERVIFVQPRAGVYTDGRTTVTGLQTPYAIGDEYVAFLRWSPESQRFVSSAGANRTVPVRNGRISWRGTGEGGVRNGMPLAAFLNLLRGLHD